VSVASEDVTNSARRVADPLRDRGSHRPGAAERVIDTADPSSGATWPIGTTRTRCRATAAEPWNDRHEERLTEETEMTARVMVVATVRAGEEEAFEAAYALVTQRVRGTTGHLRDELLRRRDRPGHYVLLSEWESLDAFLEWENAPIHREVTTPMRPYWAGSVERVLYDVPETSDTAALPAVLDGEAS
jgi:heme-degrading monooxygenase HmoA